MHPCGNRVGIKSRSCRRTSQAERGSSIARRRDKFRWQGSIDGAVVPRYYMTQQWHSETQVILELPHEEVAHGFCRESSELLRPELHLALRPDTWDTEIVRSVWLRNEYRLPPKFAKDDVIVDIGAHVGAFALAYREKAFPPIRRGVLSARVRTGSPLSAAAACSALRSLPIKSPAMCDSRGHQLR